MLNEEMVDFRDAISRITIEAVNNANSPLIARFGNLTHDPLIGGIIAGDGRTWITINAGRIIGETIPEQLPQPGFSMLYPQPGFTLPLIELPDMFSSMSGRIDPIYLCRMLKLGRKNYDNLKAGRLIRSFVDNAMQLPYGYQALPIFDHNGVFVRLDALEFQTSAIFTMKFFKFTDCPGEWAFPFKPDQPGIHLRMPLSAGEEIVLDPDFPINDSLANAWLNDAGDLTKLDWEIFRNRKTGYVWHDDGIQSRNKLEAALRFIGEAAKHSIEVRITRSTPARNGVISLPELVTQAHRYGISVPADLHPRNLCLTQSDFECFTPTDIPYFWPNGGNTLFYGSGQEIIINGLLQAFANGGTVPNKKIGICFPDAAEVRMKKMMAKNDYRQICINARILQEADRLEILLTQQEIEIVFIVFPEFFQRKELTELIERCSKMHLACAVFSSDTGFPENVDKALMDQQYLSACKEKMVFLEDRETGKVEKLYFGPKGDFSLVPGTQEQMIKVMEDAGWQQ